MNAPDLLHRNDPAANATPPAPLEDGRKTIDLLWKRVRQRGDLPGFAKAVTAILGAMQGEDDREFNMTRTVLSDPVLTQRVLRLANSPMYAVFGGHINTVSRAVIVLGTEAIGHLALGLKLIDGLSGARPDSEGACEEMGKAVLAGHIARQVAASASTRDAEEAVVCSMLHGLGRMMASFYLPEYWALIQQGSARGDAESKAALQVLGIGLDALGREVALKWNLPAQLVQSLQPVAPEEGGEPLDHHGWLGAISSLSYRSAAVVWQGEQEASLEEAVREYAPMLGLEPADILGAIVAARHAVMQEALPLPVHLAPAAEPAADADTSNALASPAPAPEKRRASDADAERAGTNPASPAVNEPVAGSKARPEDDATDAAQAFMPSPMTGVEVRDSKVAVQILVRGVRDMRAIAETATAAQLMTLALEIVQQGLRLDKAIAFIHDRDRRVYRPTLYLGSGVQALLPRLEFGDAYRPDVFHATLSTDKMVFVENARDPAFAPKLPRWWRDTLPSVRSFLLLPLSAGRKPVGFIYGDWSGIAGIARPTPEEVLPLNELRAIMTDALSRAGSAGRSTR